MGRDGCDVEMVEHTIENRPCKWMDPEDGDCTWRYPQNCSFECESYVEKI